jgi:hypothetical protein
MVKPCCPYVVQVTVPLCLMPQLAPQFSSRNPSGKTSTSRVNDGSSECRYEAGPQLFTTV